MIGWAVGLAAEVVDVEAAREEVEDEAGGRNDNGEEVDWDDEWRSRVGVPFTKEPIPELMLGR